MKLNGNYVVNSMLTMGGGLLNYYNIILYKEYNTNKDYEISSFNTSFFS